MKAKEKAASGEAAAQEAPDELAARLPVTQRRVATNEPLRHVVLAVPLADPDRACLERLVFDPDDRDQILSALQAEYAVLDDTLRRVCAGFGSTGGRDGRSYCDCKRNNAEDLHASLPRESNLRQEGSCRCRNSTLAFVFVKRFYKRLDVPLKHLFGIMHFGICAVVFH